MYLENKNATEIIRYSYGFINKKFFLQNIIFPKGTGNVAPNVGFVTNRKQYKTYSYLALLLVLYGTVCICLLTFILQSVKRRQVMDFGCSHLHKTYKAGASVGLIMGYPIEA